jgi:hypothetical protein
MSLTTWLENRWLIDHESSPQEVTNLLAVVDRDLGDAEVEALSTDRRLEIAYNAALQLSILALAAAGYRATRDKSHMYPILSLQYTVGVAPEIVDTLDSVRRKRHQANYERAGTASHSEAEEVRELASDLREEVLDWLRREHPELLEEPDGRG